MEQQQPSPSCLLRCASSHMYLPCRMQRKQTRSAGGGGGRNERQQLQCHSQLSYSFFLSLTKPVAVLTFLLRLEAAPATLCLSLPLPSLPPWPQLKASKLHFEVAACVANRCRPRQIVAKVLKPQNLIAAPLKAKDNWPIWQKKWATDGRKGIPSQ